MNVDDQVVKLNFWDTGGQEKFSKITKSYYKGAVAIIFVFDMSDKKSFINLKDWIDDTSDYLDMNQIISLIIFLLRENCLTD
jgi:GTPase SAR1 family protein